MGRSHGARGPPSGGRGHHHHAQHQPPYHHSYSGPSQGFPPPPPPPPSASAPPPPPLPPRGRSASLERDIVAFVNALRASRSDPQAPANALNMRDVLHAICAQFSAATLEELLGVPPHQVPILRQLQIQHERVWSFVTCYTHARRIHTLHECHLAFLQQEGLRHFGELGIGNSFLHTDAVQTLYHAPAVIYPLTTKDVLTAFRQFESVIGHDAFGARGGGDRGGGDRGGYNRPPPRVDRDQFKQFIAQQRRQPSTEAMGLHIDADGFGPYIAMLRRVAKKEQREIQELQDEFNKGIADRVFELSKAKFSAENRQQALDQLLQRTKEDRAKEEERTGSRSTSTSTSHGRRLSAKQATATLSSLSLEILNRVTDVDVYLDNVLQWKAADERFKGRVAAHQIADTDQKIRTQLTQFLLASQKSRHHARVKVVTWVLCGVLAKIHALLQLDDKLPDADAVAKAKQEKKKMKTKQDKAGEDEEEEEEEEEEECDCCCVGMDSCRCKCDCECHRDASDDESATKPVQTPTPTEPSTPSQEEPAKRKRSRSRSDSVSAAPVPVEEIRAALREYFESVRVHNDHWSPKDALQALAAAETQLQTKFGARLGSFSLLGHVLHAVDGSDGMPQLQPIVDAIFQGTSSTQRVAATVNEIDLRDFFAAFFARSGDKSESSTRVAIQQASAQFAIDGSDESTRQWLTSILNDVRKQAGSTEELGASPGGAIVHYVGALALPSTQEESRTLASELVLCDESESTRDHVVATKTTEALAALAACPCLVDVAVWTQWPTRFAPFLGSLRAFLRSHEMICASARDDHVCEYLWCTNDRLVRIRNGAAAAASSLDAVGLTAADLAVVLVSLCVQHPGDDFPRALVLLHLKALLKTVDHDEDHGLARYVLDALLAVPVEFAAFVFALLQDAATPSLARSDALAATVGTASPVEMQQLSVMAQRVPALASVLRQQTTSKATTQPAPTPASREAPPRTVKPPVLVLEEIQTQQQQCATSPDLVCAMPSSECEAFITQLRREQFGVGLEIHDQATREVLRVQHRRLERALKRLSDELYSEKTHFVLELLQNADDNQYAPSVVPGGAFTLTRDGAIVFANNEVGFSTANVRAICDVGASTKASTSATSIGKKGIGFKSVFKVSDVPEVHSNGFHLRFHAKDEQHGAGIGYILPYWMENRTAWRAGQGTTFVLPLNAHSAVRQQEIASSLLAFEPSVLLFLQQIRELRLVNEVAGARLSFHKHDQRVSVVEEDYVVSISTLQSARLVSTDTATTEETTTQRWVVVRRKLSVPTAFTSQRGDTTEIAIALPLRDQPGLQEEEEDDHRRRPPLQDVYCYLPLRSYGLRFIVQGDFEVPSSREAIANGSDWNQWLIARYAVLFPALLASRQLPLTQLVRLLPLESDVQPPFRSAVAAISRQVRSVACFPTTEGDDCLAAPTDLLDTSEFDDADEEDLALLHHGDLVYKALGKRVLQPSLARATPPMVKAQLRIERLRVSHVLRLLSYVSSTTQDSVLRQRRVLDLLHLLARLWRHERHLALMLQELRRIKCFLLRSGQWTSVGDAVVFLPGATSQSSRLKLVKGGELCLLGDEFAAALNGIKSADTRRFLLEHVGVKELQDHELIVHHVLPALTTLTVAAGPTKWRELIEFLAGHFTVCPSTSCSLAATVREAMRVVTWRQRVLATVSDPSVFVLLPRDARTLNAFASWLRGKLQTTEGETFDIVWLDQLNGVDDEALRTLWVDVCGCARLCDVASDRTASAMATIVQWIHNETDPDTKRRVSSELATFLAATWPDASQQGLKEEWWQSAAWLEACDGAFYRPQDLWISSPQVDAVFSHAMVPFAKVAIESESNVRRVWALQTSPTVDDALRVLRSHSESSTVSSLDASEWTCVYSFLLDQSRRDCDPTTASMICSAFASSAMIYTPLTTTNEEDADERGRFVGVHDAVWSNDSRDDAATPSLDQIYPKTLRAFFVSVCGVERKPTIAMLTLTLKTHLDEDGDGSPRRWRARVFPILKRLAKLLRKDKLSSSDAKTLKKTLKKAAWVPVMEGDSELRLVHPHSAKIVCFGYQDDEAGGEIERLWTALATTMAEPLAVQLVGVAGVGDLTDLEPLLRHAGVPSITDSLYQEPTRWCQALATLAAAAAVGESKIVKRYQKLLRRVLLTWAKTTDLPRPSELALLPLFPSIAGQLHRGVDLFINDQSVLSREQITGSSLHVLGLFPWSFFVHSSDDADSIRCLLTDHAQVKSLVQHLHTEVVLLGPTHAAGHDEHAHLHRVLAIAQRVVLHQHPQVYDRLDHSEMRRVLPTIKIVHVEGETGVLQLLHRVATTDMAVRETVACYLDRGSQQLFVASSQDARHATTFDLLLAICRQCFGPTVAASIANVLFLASMQASDDVLEAWLVHTQKVPPLDARCGARAMWFTGEEASSLTRTKRPREAETDQTEEPEEGEVEDDDAPVSVLSPQTKRMKQHHHHHQQQQQSWDSQSVYPIVPPGGGNSAAYPGGSSGHHHQQQQYAGGYSGSAYTTMRSLPLVPGVNTLSDEEKLAIGRWGEEYVYQQLQQSYAAREEVAVDWVNEKEESGLPYDIVVKTRTSNDVEYVEVKATRTMEKGVFEISMNELDQAATHGSRYSIYRVFNAGNPAMCRVVRMKNPIALVRQRKIQLVLMMQ